MSELRCGPGFQPGNAVEPALPGHWRCPLEGEAASTASGVTHFSQPRRRKYHIGNSALASISASA
jgi:hypothetical protein